MKKKLIKILLLLMVMIFLLGTLQVLAINPDDYKPDITTGDNRAFERKVEKLLGTISSIGSVCAVIVIVVIGMKYMLGSVDEKAEYKKTMTTYLLGAVLLFSCTTVPNTIYNFVNPKYEYLEYVVLEYKENNNSKVFYDWCLDCDVLGSMCPARRGLVSEAHSYGSKILENYNCGNCNKSLSRTEQQNRQCDDCGKGDIYYCSHCYDRLTSSERQQKKCGNTRCPSKKQN